MSDDKAELANFFNKKKQKSKKKLIVDVADAAPLSTSKDATDVVGAGTSATTAEDVSNGNTTVAVKLSDNGWVEEVEPEQIVFETGGKTIIDMSENENADAANDGNNDTPLPIKFDAEKTWGGRVESSTDTATTTTTTAAAPQPAAPAKYVVRAKQQGPPKLQDFPELGAAAPEPEPKKKNRGSEAPPPSTSSSSSSSSTSSSSKFAPNTSSSSSGGEKYRPPMSRGADDRRWN